MSNSQYERQQHGDYDKLHHAFIPGTTSHTKVLDAGDNEFERACELELHLFSLSNRGHFKDSRRTNNGKVCFYHGFITLTFGPSSTSSPCPTRRRSTTYQPALHVCTHSTFSLCPPYTRITPYTYLQRLRHASQSIHVHARAGRGRRRTASNQTRPPAARKPVST